MQVVLAESFQGDPAVMLEMAGCIERTSAHPVAAAIVGHAASLGLNLTHNVTDSQDVPGEGMCFQSHLVARCGDAEVEPHAVGSAQ